MLECVRDFVQIVGRPLTGTIKILGSENMDRIMKTCWWYIILALVWQGLELLIYHQIQPRVVDDIMGLLYLPFIYKAVD